MACLETPTPQQQAMIDWRKCAIQEHINLINEAINTGAWQYSLFGYGDWLAHSLKSRGYQIEQFYDRLIVRLNNGSVYVKNNTNNATINSSNPSIVNDGNE